MRSHDMQSALNVPRLCTFEKKCRQAIMLPEVSASRCVLYTRRASYLSATPATTTFAQTAGISPLSNLARR